MLLAELQPEGWAVIITAALAGIGSIVLGIVQLWLTHRREQAKIAREDAIEERTARREKEKAEKLEAVAKALHDEQEATRKENEIRAKAAMARDKKLDTVTTKMTEVAKQTDGMKDELVTAVKEAALAQGRLMEKEKLEAAVAANGNAEKLDKIEHTTEEIKSDTSVLVKEIASDVKQVVKDAKEAKEKK